MITAKLMVIDRGAVVKTGMLYCDDEDQLNLEIKAIEDTLEPNFQKWIAVKILGKGENESVEG